MNISEYLYKSSKYSLSTFNCLILYKNPCVVIFNCTAQQNAWLLLIRNIYKGKDVIITIYVL